MAAAGDARSKTGTGSRSRAKASTSPTDGRELRSQGRKTMARLLDAGMEVLGERGYHAARVDDVVRVAKVSHGTFYLYFSNKEDLFRALAMQCAEEMTALAGSLGPVGPGPDGLDELRRWLTEFVATYRTYGVVIRAWMEDQVSSRELARLGATAFTGIAGSLVTRIEEAQAGSPHDAELRAAALLAMIERFTYFVTSRNLAFDDGAVIGTLAAVIHRGFFVVDGQARGTRLKLAGA